MVAVKYLKDYLNLSHTLNMEFQKVNLWDSVILFINLGKNLYRNHRASEKLLYVHFLANSNIWRLSVTLLFPYSGLSSPLLSWASPLLVCQAGQHHGHWEEFLGYCHRPYPHHTVFKQHRRLWPDTSSGDSQWHGQWMSWRWSLDALWSSS